MHDNMRPELSKAAEGDKATPVLSHNSRKVTQHTTQHPHFDPVLLSERSEPFRRVYEPPCGTPSRISILARVAASNTSSTPSALSAEHSLYARAPSAFATSSAPAAETYSLKCGEPGGGRKSDLHPTRMTGIVGPQMERTSSIHLTATLSSESGVSMENAIRITCDFEYERGRNRSILLVQPYPTMPIAQVSRRVVSPQHNFQR